jgi:hypothetical protein
MKATAGGFQYGPNVGDNFRKSNNTSVRLCVAFNRLVFRRMDAKKVPTTRAIKQIEKTIGIRRWHYIPACLNPK